MHFGERKKMCVVFQNKHTCARRSAFEFDESTDGERHGRSGCCDKSHWLQAGKRLLGRVRHLMGAENASPVASIVALVTGKRLLARVRHLMGAEMASLCVAIVALVTGKRLLARVRQLMNVETAARGAAIVALITRKRFFGNHCLQSPPAWLAGKAARRRLQPPRQVACDQRSTQQ